MRRRWLRRLQFDVMQFRLENEYGAPCRFEPLSHGNPMVLFRDEYALGWALRNSPGVTFHETEPE